MDIYLKDRECYAQNVEKLSTILDCESASNETTVRWFTKKCEDTVDF